MARRSARDEILRLSDANVLARLVDEVRSLRPPIRKRQPPCASGSPARNCSPSASRCVVLSRGNGPGAN
jgi:hypothetical protein